MYACVYGMKVDEWIKKIWFNNIVEYIAIYAIQTIVFTNLWFCTELFLQLFQFLFHPADLTDRPVLAGAKAVIVFVLTFDAPEGSKKKIMNGIMIVICYRHR